MNPQLKISPINLQMVLQKIEAIFYSRPTKLKEMPIADIWLYEAAIKELDPSFDIDDLDFDAFYEYYSRGNALISFCKKNSEQLRFLKLVIKDQEETRIHKDMFVVFSQIHIPKSREVSFDSFSRLYKKIQKS